MNGMTQYIICSCSTITLYGKSWACPLGSCKASPEVPKGHTAYHGDPTDGPIACTETDCSHRTTDTQHPDMSSLLIRGPYHEFYEGNTDDEATIQKILKARADKGLMFN